MLYIRYHRFSVNKCTALSINIITFSVKGWFIMDSKTLDLSKIGRITDISTVRTDVTMDEVNQLIDIVKSFHCVCASPMPVVTKYVIDALEKGWAWGWKKKGWIKSDKKPALNPDLWETLLNLSEIHELHCHWVKGHAENVYNNRCDALAVSQRDKFSTIG